jgi:hypothetical protein
MNNPGCHSQATLLLLSLEGGRWNTRRHGGVQYVADPEALEYNQSLTMTDEDSDYIDKVYNDADDDGEDAVGDQKSPLARIGRTRRRTEDALSLGLVITPRPPSSDNGNGVA